MNYSISGKHQSNNNEDVLIYLDDAHLRKIKGGNRVAAFSDYTFCCEILISDLLHLLNKTFWTQMSSR